MLKWLKKLQSLVAQSTPVMVVTVASVKGSTPREPGAKMLVTAENTFGTIGGGHLEFKATQIAQEMLTSQPTQQLRSFPLGASLGQCCGGLVNLLFEPVAEDAEWLYELSKEELKSIPSIMITAASGSPQDSKVLVTESAIHGSFGDQSIDQHIQALAYRQLISGKSALLRALKPSSEDQGEALYLFEPIRSTNFNIVLFGAGHVGEALVNTLKGLECDITWVDSRDNQFTTELPGNVTAVTTESPEAEVDEAPPGSYFIVMTHDHSLDQMICEQILKRTDYSYLGLIGSTTKRRRFEQRFIQRGVKANQLATMRCPVGLNGITSKQPAAIAIDIAGELLQRYEQIQKQSVAPNHLTRITPDSTGNDNLKLTEERG